MIEWVEVEGTKWRFSAVKDMKREAFVKKYGSLFENIERHYDEIEKHIEVPKKADKVGSLKKKENED